MKNHERSGLRVSCSLSAVASCESWVRQSDHLTRSGCVPAADETPTAKRTPPCRGRDTAPAVQPTFDLNDFTAESAEPESRSHQE